MKKEILRITIVQSDLVWENLPANLEMFSGKLSAVTDTDIVVLPEMFTTGFTMESRRFAEGMNGAAMNWMRAEAESMNCVVCGGFIAYDDGKLYNRHVWMRPDGSYEFYDKKHLFRMAGEHNHYSAGNRRVVVELSGWRFCLQTCYDLRFPVWSRNRNDYDVLIYIANWPEQRRDPWITLLVARAMENQVYVIGVNRVGKDGRNINHSGDSAVIHPIGYAICNLRSYTEGIETVEISYSELERVRKAFPIALDADDFELK